MKWSLCEYLCWHWTCFAIISHLEAEYLFPPFFVICRPASVKFSFSKRFVLFLLLLRQNNNFPSPNIFLLFCFCFPSLGQKKTNFPSLLQTKYFISQDISSFSFFSHNSSFLPQIFSSVSSSIVFLLLPFFDRPTMFLSSPFPFSLTDQIFSL